MGAVTQKLKKTDVLAEITERVRKKMEEDKTKRQGDIRIAKTQTPKLNSSEKDMRQARADAGKLRDCLDKGSVKALDEWGRG
jgi:hypothetical protein